MTATRQLSVDYAKSYTFDLQTDFKLLVWLNLAGLALFLPAAWGYLALAVAWNPNAVSISRVLFPPIPILALLTGYVLSMLVFMVLHEIIHGFFFWVFTHARPVFGFRGAYAFAAAPEWYIARRPYLWIGLAPFLLLSGAAILAIPVLPSNFLFFWLFGMLINFSGSVGDLYVVLWLMRQPGEILVQDFGDKIVVFHKQAS